MTPSTHSIRTRCVFAAIAFALSSANLFAGNTWTGGGGSNNWSDNNNWGGAQPGYGTLTFSGSARTTNIDDNITSMNQLLWTGSSPWTLNQGGSTVLSLFDNGGGQAKIENQSTGLVTINLPITFAANNGSPPNPFGEINAVNGDLLFGTGTLTVNGSSVNGIKMFGSNHTTTFNDTVSASGKWFGLTGVGTTMAVGGAFTSGDIYVMNSGTLALSSTGSITTSALRLGGDFGNTGSQNQTLGGTFALTNATGGQSFSSTINTVTGNTSNALLIDSQNTSGTNTISSGVFLDSDLKTQTAGGGTLLYQGGSFDIKARTLTVSGSGNTTINESLGSSSAAGGSLVKTGAGTLILQNTTNNYTGTDSTQLNPNGTQINNGVLGIYGALSLGLAPTGAYNNIQFTGSATLQDTANNITLGTTRNISIANGATATFDSNGNVFELDGIISGSGGAVSKIGNGTLTLTGTNTYSGATTIAGGTLSVSTIGNSGGSSNLGSNGTINVGSIATAGTLLYTGNGETSNKVINLAGTTGGATLDQSGTGLLKFTTNLTATGAGIKTLTLQGSTAGTGEIGGLIVDNSSTNKTSVVKNGTGTWTLSAANTYTGGTTLNSGTLNINAGTTATLSSLGTGTFTINGGTIDNTFGALTTVQLVPTIDNADFTFGGTNNLTFTSSASLNIAAGGTRTITLNGTNSTLTFGAVTAMTDQSGDGVLTVNGSGNTLVFGSLVTNSHAIGVGGELLTINGSGNLKINGAVSGGKTADMLTYSGTGVLTLAGGTANTLTGVTTVNSGEVDLSKTSGNAIAGNLLIGDGTGTDTVKSLASNQIADTSGLTINSSGVFDLNGKTETIATLTGASATSSVSLGAGALTLNSGSNSSFAGVISGTGGSLIKTGNGTLTFSGSSANTYTGLTTVSGGELDLNKTAGVNAIAGDGNTATNDVTVSGGTLKWLADNQVGDTATITITSPGTVDLNGHTETLGTLINTGGTFQTGTGHLIGTTASIQWAGGTNTINAGGIVEDGHIAITGGTNTVQGGATEGQLHLQSGGLGLQMNGSTLTLNSDNTNPGRLLLDGDVSTSASSTTSSIANGGSATNAGKVDLNSGTRMFTVADGAAAVDMSISANITNGTLQKEGAGVLAITGANTHSGTIINGGTLQAGVGSLVSVTGNITVNTGGTLLLNGAGRHIGSAVGVNLNGGTFNTNGLSEPGGAVDGTQFIGALTLTSTSTLNFGAGNSSVVEFAGTSHVPSSSVLNIINWDNVVGVGGAGGDRLLFNGSVSDFVTKYDQTDVTFDGITGYNAIQIATGMDPYYEIVGLAVSVPEPSTWLASAFAVGFIAFGLIRRLPRR